MPSKIAYSLHPGVDIERIHDQVSVQAFYTLDLLFEHRDAAPFTFEEIDKLSLDARRFHTGRLLRKCLAELVKAKALVVVRRTGR
jgi:hypothetical protein